MKRLFIIGMNKTGTRSLHRLFEASGYSSVHWDDGKLAYRIEDNVKAGRDPIEGYDTFQVFSDMEGTYDRPIVEAYRHFRQIHAAHPDALFLLNYRDVDDWLQSKRLHGIKRHGHPIYLRHYKTHLGLQSDEDVLHHWRRCYYEHIVDVLAFFAEKPKSLVLFNLDRDTPEALAECVKPAFHINPAHWSHIGKTTWKEAPA